MTYIRRTLYALALLLIMTQPGFTGHADNKTTDALEHAVAYFFDLRDRETYIQITNTDVTAAVLHIQIWNVNDNCGENNFFDSFTTNDTHVYNMRDIQTNDGNPSGVILPDNAYGAVVIYVGESGDFNTPDRNRDVLMGNLRILDNNGYEYRSNGSGLWGSNEGRSFPVYTLNFNSELGVTLSDIVHFRNNGSENTSEPFDLSDVLDAKMLFDVNILDTNEIIFSCRNVIFSCVNQEHPLLEELLEEVGNSSVASFEYGINDIIPHSKGAPLLCPGNNISEGVVTLDPLLNVNVGGNLASFIGLNNGNGRGSFDTWLQNTDFNN